MTRRLVNPTRGGLVHDAVYDDICIRNSSRPIDITAAYAANGPVKGNSPPTFRDVTLHNVRNCDYRTETDYTPRWETRPVDLARLSGLDLAIKTIAG